MSCRAAINAFWGLSYTQVDGLAVTATVSGYLLGIGQLVDAKPIHNRRKQMIQCKPER